MWDWSTDFINRYLEQSMVKSGIVCLIFMFLGFELGILSDIQFFIIILIGLQIFKLLFIFGFKDFNNGNLSISYKVGVFWYFKLIKGKKVKDRDEIKRLNEVFSNASQIFSAIFDILIFSIVLEEPKVVFFIFIIMLENRETFYWLDKFLRSYRKFEGVCVGSISSRGRGSNHYSYTQSIVNSEEKSEMNVKVDGRVIQQIRLNRRVEVTYGILSKKVVSVRYLP